MLYRVLKILIRLTLSIFFRSKWMKGVENIPKSGPLILVANHPVTFMDPFLVAISLNRTVHFLAKGSMFKSRWVRVIFKQFKMIPIYRAQDNRADLSKNEDTFQYCYEHLEKDGVLLIFPEGISVTDRSLKPIKTGAARIALGAEKRNEFKLGVKIVPFGLNYEVPHKFRKDVLINVGEPIEVNKLEDLYGKGDKEAVHKLTGQIEQALKDQLLYAKNHEDEVLIAFLLQQNANEQMSFDQNVERVKKWFREVSNIGEPEEEEVINFRRRLVEFYNKQKRFGIENLYTNDGRPIWLETIFFGLTLIIGIPIFLFGFVHNCIPYYISPMIAKKVSKDIEYQGPIAMISGMVICLVSYPIFGWFMFQFSESWWLTILYVISLPIAGVITYGFYRQFDFLRAQWKLMLLFNRKKEVIAELIVERQQINKELKTLGGESR